MSSDAFKTIEGMDFAGKRVLLRADLNVPVQDGKVTDATRIERVVPTIREITKAGGKAILLSHFGRPKGKVDKAFSLEQVVPAVVEATGHPVGFIDTDWVDVQDGKRGDRLGAGRLDPGAREHPLPSGRGRERSRTRQAHGVARATFSSMTRSRRRTARTPRPKGWRICCRRRRGSPCRPSSRRSRPVSAIRRSR